MKGNGCWPAAGLDVRALWSPRRRRWPAADESSAAGLRGLLAARCASSRVQAAGAPRLSPTTDLRGVVRGALPARTSSRGVRPGSADLRKVSRELPATRWNSSLVAAADEEPGSRIGVFLAAMREALLDRSAVACGGSTPSCGWLLRRWSGHRSGAPGGVTARPAAALPTNRGVEQPDIGIARDSKMPNRHVPTMTLSNASSWPRDRQRATAEHRVDRRHPTSVECSMTALRQFARVRCTDSTWRFAWAQRACLQLEKATRRTSSDQRLPLLAASIALMT